MFIRFLQIVMTVLLLMLSSTTLYGWSNAGTNRYVTSGQWATLDGSKSTARSGYRLKGYQWYHISGPTATVTGATSSKLKVLAPDVSSQQTIVYKLRLIEQNIATGKYAGTDDYAGVI